MSCAMAARPSVVILNYSGRMRVGDLYEVRVFL
jgi:hypothetical protein